MKGLIGLAAAAAALGLWAGFSAWQSASLTWAFHVGMAVLFAVNLLFCLWLWRRAAPGSGDAMFLPTLCMLQGSALLMILPRLFWPAHEVLQLAGSTVSLIVVMVLAVRKIRQRRRVRPRA